MGNETELNEIVAEIRREQARIWRKNNKDKVKEINKRYWLKKAQKILDERKNNTKEVN